MPSSSSLPCIYSQPANTKTYGNVEGGYGNVNDMGWSNCNIQKDVFSFNSQLPPVDFRVGTSGFYGINDLENTDKFCMQANSNVLVVDDFPMAEMFLNDPFYSAPYIPEQNNNYTLVPENFYQDSESVSSGSWNHETKTGFLAKPEQQKQLVLVDNEKKKLGKRPREVKDSSVMSSIKTLSRETISKYFYMPITQAARELNVGLTLLKKRCRDLGIRRWPHRKLISLQTLIKNVQELENEGSSREGKMNEYLRILEQEKKLLEEIPDMQLEVGLMRKLMGLDDSSSTKSEPFANLVTGASTEILASGHENAVNFCGFEGRVDYGYGDDDYDDEIKFFLDDCFSFN